MAFMPSLLAVIGLLIKILIVFGVTQLTVAYLTYFERKVAGHIQVRYGPMRVGLHGLLQPIADGIKLFLKEDIVPHEADRIVFTLSPLIVVVIALSLFALVPFGPSLYVTDVNIGLLLLFSLSSLGVFGIVMAGWSSNSKYAMLGGMRSSAQMISYEIPLGLSVIGALILAKSLSMVEIVRAQEGHLLYGLFPKWYAFFQPLGFFIYCVSAVAETNRLPFDLPEAETELVAGYHVEYSGMKFAFFFLGEYANMIMVSAIATTVFLGGWQQPTLPLWLVFILPMVYLSIKGKYWRKLIFLYLVVGTVVILGNFNTHEGLSPLVGLFWFVGKVGFLLYGFMWLRWTLPRLRYDQLMSLGWYWLLPLALLNILATGLFRYLYLR